MLKEDTRVVSALNKYWRDGRRQVAAAVDQLVNSWPELGNRDWTRS